VYLRNWLDAVRSGKQPSADAVAGHYSVMACHMAKLAYQQKACVTWKKECKV
jgi:hypothetical protein